MKTDCEHYNDCREPVQVCNNKCRQYEKAEWARAEQTAAGLKEDQGQDNLKGHDDV